MEMENDLKELVANLSQEQREVLLAELKPKKAPRVKKVKLTREEIRNSVSNSTDLSDEVKSYLLLRLQDRQPRDDSNRVMIVNPLDPEVTWSGYGRAPAWYVALNEETQREIAPHKFK